MTPEEIVSRPVFKMFDEMIDKCKATGNSEDAIVLHPKDYAKFLGGVDGEITYKGWKIKSSEIIPEGKCYAVSYAAFFETLQMFYDTFNNVDKL